MKIIFVFLVLWTVGIVNAGDTCVWQVYKSSFTTGQWESLKNAAHAKVETMNQPVQKFRILKRSGGLAVQGDCSIRDLAKVQSAEAEGKIRYIGLWHYTNLGYDRQHEDWQILKRFFYTISKSTYTVEGSTETP